MKTLTLLRHAKSGSDDPALRDFDRQLNAKGRRAARAVGRHLAGAGAAFDHVVASPAVRVIQTLEEVAAGYGAPIAPVWEKRIYLASAVTLLDVVQETSDEADRLLLVGHNPGLEDLVLYLARDDGAELRQRVEQKYPTASLAVLQFDVEAWADASPGQAVLVSFVRPRDLDPELGPDYE